MNLFQMLGQSPCEVVYLPFVQVPSSLLAHGPFCAEDLFHHTDNARTDDLFDAVFAIVSSSVNAGYCLLLILQPETLLRGSECVYLQMSVSLDGAKHAMHQINLLR